VNSKDRKGVVARVWSWVQSFWLQPDGNTCQEYVFIAVVTLVFAFLFAAPPANPAATAGTLLLGLTIASLVKGIMWKDEKLLALRRVLLRIAFEECHCGSKSQCHCHVWLARAVLDEDCPGAIETEIRERLGEYRDENDGRWVLNNLPFSDTQGPLPKDLDLAAYLYPAELEWHRANGQLPEAHQASPQ
jgi:hypothetical protein